MDQDKTKELKINFITALSTAVLAFVGSVGLVLALAQFIENKSTFLGFGGVVWLITTVSFGLLVLIWQITRWVKNG